MSSTCPGSRALALVTGALGKLYAAFVGWTGSSAWHEWVRNGLIRNGCVREGWVTNGQVSNGLVREEWVRYPVLNDHSFIC